MPEATAARLVALAQRRLIVPERSRLPGHDAFRFGHALIREAAYRNLPRRRRGELHEAVARWVEALPGTYDEIAGHHLAEAHAARAALGEPDPELAAEAARAARRRRRRRAAARRSVGRARACWSARRRCAMTASCSPRSAPRCSRRAASRTPRACSSRRPAARAIRGSAPARWSSSSSSGSRRTRPRPGTCRTPSGRRSTATRRPSAASGCCAAGSRGTPDGWPRPTRPGRGPARAPRRPACSGTCSRSSPGARPRRRSGPCPPRPRSGAWRGSATLVAASPIATASVLNPLAYLHAMRGDFAGAEALLAEASAILDGAGRHRCRLLAPGGVRAPARGPARARRGAAARGRRAAHGDGRGLLARHDEGAARPGRARPGPSGGGGRAGGRGRPPHGAAGRARRRRSGAACAPGRWRTAGRHDEALALASEAVAVLEPTDLLSHRGDAMLDLAAVLSTSEQREESEHAVRSAVALYARKGNAVAAERAQQLLPDRQGGR